jgi:hypothetical protein
MCCFTRFAHIMMGWKPAGMLPNVLRHVSNLRSGDETVQMTPLPCHPVTRSFYARP